MFDRLKINSLYKWWLSIDKTVLFLIILLMVMGNIFTTIASPIVASRIGAISNRFIVRNAIFSILGVMIIVASSALNEKQIKLGSILGYFAMILLMVAVLVFGSVNKGAKRWIYIFGFSLQPSEIIKPFFVIFTSYILTEFKKDENQHIIMALILYVFLSFLLVLQPDIGMLILISMVFFLELYLIMVPIKYFAILGAILSVGLIILYLLFPHFHDRINIFYRGMFMGGAKSYQVQKSLSAFANGGMLGKGPLEGSIKNSIPDAHTDFIFPVIGEEFGAVVCIFIIFVYFYIAIRNILKTIDGINNFRYLSITSLSFLFLLQSVINIGVTLNLLPTKGMTLPLISYGGSSMFGISITLGFILALSKRMYGDFGKTKYLLER